MVSPVNPLLNQILQCKSLDELNTITKDMIGEHKLKLKFKGREVVIITKEGDIPVETIRQKFQELTKRGGASSPVGVQIDKRIRSLEPSKPKEIKSNKYKPRLSTVQEQEVKQRSEPRVEHIDPAQFKEALLKEFKILKDVDPSVFMIRLNGFFNKIVNNHAQAEGRRRPTEKDIDYGKVFLNEVFRGFTDWPEGVGVFTADDIKKRVWGFIKGDFDTLSIRDED